MSKRHSTRQTARAAKRKYRAHLSAVVAVTTDLEYPVLQGALDELTANARKLLFVFGEFGPGHLLVRVLKESEHRKFRNRFPRAVLERCELVAISAHVIFTGTEYRPDPPHELTAAELVEVNRAIVLS